MNAHTRTPLAPPVAAALPWHDGADTYCRVGPWNITIRDSKTLPQEFRSRHGRYLCWAMLMLPSASRRWGGKIAMEEPHLLHRGGFGAPQNLDTCYWYYSSLKLAKAGMERRFYAVLAPYIGSQP